MHKLSSYTFNRLRLFAAISFAVFISSSTSASANSSFTIGSAIANVNDTFTIDISVSGVYDLQSFQFDLNYDSSKLSLISFTDIGTTFDSVAAAGGGNIIGISGFDSNPPGQISGITNAMTLFNLGASGLTDGTIAKITFQDIAAGTALLSVSNIFAYTGDFSPITFDNIVNGQVGQGIPNIPEPSTIVLFGIGVFGLLKCRKSNQILYGVKS